MKSYTIIRDKKTLCYLTVYFLLTIISLTFFKVSVNNLLTNNIENMNGTKIGVGVILITILILFWLFIFIMSKLVTFIYIDNRGIKKGLIFPKFIPFEEIQDIEIEEGLSIKSESKCINVPIFNAKQNYEKYKKIINNIVDISGLDAKCDLILKKVSDYECEKYCLRGNQSLQLDGWLKILFIYFIISFVIECVMVIQDISLGGISIVQFSFGLGVALITLFIVVLIAVKYRKAVQVVITCLWINFTLTCLLNFLVAISSNLTITYIINLFLSIASQLIIVLMITRYFKISKRVEHTFKRDGLFIKEKSISEKNKPKVAHARKPVRIVVLSLIFVLVTFIVIDIIKHYNSADTKIYSSIEEIIETKYDGEGEYIEYDDYYYIIYNNGKVNQEQLIWSYKDNEYIVFNEWHDITKQSRSIFELFHDKYLFAEINVEIHEDKYIVLFIRRRLDATARVYDNYDDWECMLINDVEYYFKVLDKTDILKDYKVCIEVDNNEIYLVGAEEFGLN